ncbi:MAG: glycosyltransferase family 39 protein [Phaeodactylibacter sp.]|uniref:ArnT family glycosyltransferase n=1 Tax=Phaeodactylibacter sp. TaxID=1940289 RepID=UPI0032ED77CC
MTNSPIWWGVLLGAVFCFGYAWYFHNKSRHNTAVLLLMLGGFLLRLFSANDPFLNPWDERFHALVAKHMMSHPFRPMLYAHPVLPYPAEDWSANHIWLHKQPFALWLMSGSMKLFGTHLLALRLPSVLITTLGTGAMYGLGKRLYHARIGFVAAFLWAIHGMLVELAGGRRATDHVDAVFVALILFGAYWALRAAQQKRMGFTLITGLLTGLAVLTKWLPGLIVLPVWALWAIHYRQYSWKSWFGHGLLMTCTAFVVAAPWQIYTHQAFPVEARWEQYYNYLHLFEGLEGHDQSWYFHLNNIRMLFGEFIYLPLVWWAWVALRKRTDASRWALLVWIAIPLGFFSFAATKMPAYILISAPAIFLITALAWQHFKIYQYRFGRWRRLVQVFIMGLLLLPVRYSFERLKPLDRDEAAWAKRIEVEGLRQTSSADSVIYFNVPHPIETMFFLGGTAYGYTPGQGVVDSLRKEGYRVIVKE